MNIVRQPDRRGRHVRRTSLVVSFAVRWGGFGGHRDGWLLDRMVVVVPRSRATCAIGRRDSKAKCVARLRSSSLYFFGAGMRTWTLPLCQDRIAWLRGVRQTQPASLLRGGHEDLDLSSLSGQNRLASRCPSDLACLMHPIRGVGVP